MKKSIKNYLQFIKENTDSPNQKSRTELLKLREEFRDKLDDLADLNPDPNAPHGGGIGGTYFSNMCKWENANPEEDFKKLQSIVDKNGYTLETIKELFSKSANEICRQNFADFVLNRNFLEYKYREPLDEKNGNVDFYLYKISELIYNPSNYRPLLGGDAWSYNSDQVDDEEFLIRFAYGYHNTPYGKLYLEQVGDTPEQWREKGYKILDQWVRERWMEPFNVLNDMKNIDWSSLHNWFKESNEDLFSKYIIIERDRIIIYAKEVIEDISKDLNVDLDIDKKFNEVYHKYVNLFSYFPEINLVETGDEILILLEDYKLDASF